MKLERIPVRIVEKIKSLSPRIYVWWIEVAFVFGILASVAVIRIIATGHGWVEWIGVFAVTFTFSHASVANRMEEKEGKRVEKTGKPEVECYKSLQRYFYLKEICWLVYFVLVGAYSALIGTGIFLTYGWWRKTWRKYHPLV